MYAVNMHGPTAGFFLRLIILSSILESEFLSNSYASTGHVNNLKNCLVFVTVLTLNVTFVLGLLKFSAVELGHFLIVNLTTTGPVASLGLALPGAPTDGVNPIFPQKTDDLFCSSLSLLLISFGCHPLEGVTRGSPPPSDATVEANCSYSYVIKCKCGIRY